MYDGGCLSEPGPLQRAVGELRVAVKRSGQETMLDELRQAGCLKARFPRRVVPGWLDVVMLNTGGGVAGGDRLDVGDRRRCRAPGDDRRPGRGTVLPSAARCDAAVPRARRPLTVAAGAAAGMAAAGDDPVRPMRPRPAAGGRTCQPTRASSASRRWCSAAPRWARRCGQGWLRDLIRIRRDGDSAAARRDPPRRRHRRTPCSAPPSPAGPRWSRRWSMSPRTPRAAASDAVPRRLLARVAEAAASAWNGMLIARILGPDSASVRRTVMAALTVLRDARPLPRVWLC